VFGTVQLLLALSATAGEDETSGLYKRPSRAPCEFSTSVTSIHAYTHTCLKIRGKHKVVAYVT
jgi:hypothetical protein